MLTDVSAIRTYFAKLGLEPEIADIYLALHHHGPQNISELARNSKVERTRIYRLIDTLLASNLIEIEARSRRGIVKPAPISNLRILISQKEHDLRSLEDELGLIEQMLARNSLSNAAFRIQTYQGPEGIRQMRWNTLRAQTEILGYETQSLEPYIGKKSMERWLEECTERGLYGRLLLAESIQAEARTEKLQVRLLSIEAAHNLLIYNDVLAYYYWHNHEPFGLEIHNQDHANTQRQLIDFLWGDSRSQN